MNWQKFSGGEIKDIHLTLKEDIKKHGKENLNIWVGSDSQVHKTHSTFVTSIVIYNVGHGGWAYYTSEKINRKFSHKERLWAEVEKSIVVAQIIEPTLKYMDTEITEIHADLNGNKKYLSNGMVKSCLGYIQSMGYVGKIKPDAFGATYVANVKTK